MTVRASATVAATPEDVWPWIAEPARWPEWAWHLRGASGLGAEVASGRSGVVWTLGVVPVPVTVLAVDRPRGWSWRAGPIRVDHALTPDAGGCRATFALSAPGPLEALIRPVYGPVMRRAARRLSEVVGRADARAPAGR